MPLGEELDNLWNYPLKMHMDVQQFILVFVVCRDAVSDLALHFLAKMKIMVVKDIDREDIEFVCKVSEMGVTNQVYTRVAACLQTTS